MADRKQRLAALSAKAGRAEQPVDNSNNSGNDQEEVSSASSKPTISFRNYVPKDASLDPAASTTSPMQEDEEPITKRQKTNTTDQRNKEDKTQKSSLEIALAKTSHESRDAAGQNHTGGWSNVTHIAPKKVNADLKRDIQSKMDKLERRTQRAIVELLRERLEKEAAEGGGADDDSDLD